MNDNVNFTQECQREIVEQSSSADFLAVTHDWLMQANSFKYSYHFNFLGRPIIQYPQDIIAMQELIWEVKPDLIIETGIARGGSLMMSASMLVMLDYCDAIASGVKLDPTASGRKVLGIDIDIREHNRDAINSHPLAHKIEMIQGSSVDLNVINRVHEIAGKYSKVLVCLDSNHTHQHVLDELKAYAPLVSKGSYCVVFDTIIEDYPDDVFLNRPWGKGDNPKTAVHAFLEENKINKNKAADGQDLNFMIDKEIEGKLLITVAPDGYLKRI